MHYLVSVLSDGQEAPVDEHEYMEQIREFNDSVRDRGYWVYANGWVSPGEAKVVDNRSKKTIVTDGPYLETKEFMAGSYVFDCPSAEIAMQLATEASRACNRRMEIRAQAVEPD